MKKALMLGVASLVLALFSGAVGVSQQPLSDPKALFEEAQRALRAHDYPKAEQGFRAVLRIDPRSAPAYANLGVVYMRESEYGRALEAFQNAKRLAPQVAGLDLNLGLAYYHQNDFAEAIPPFTRVLHSDPEQAQARYLLGMSYFLTDDFARTAATLAPLFDRQKSNLDYLYVLGIAYAKLQRPEDSARTFEQMVRAGGDSPQLHLLMGKAHLDLLEISLAQRAGESPGP